MMNLIVFNMYVSVAKKTRFNQMVSEWMLCWDSWQNATSMLNIACPPSRTLVVDASMPGHRTVAKGCICLSCFDSFCAWTCEILPAWRRLANSPTLSLSWRKPSAFPRFHAGQLPPIHLPCWQKAGGSAMLLGWRLASCTRISWSNFLTELRFGDGKNIVLDILRLAWQLQPY